MKFGIEFQDDIVRTHELWDGKNGVEPTVKLIRPEYILSAGNSKIPPHMLLISSKRKKNINVI